MSCFWILLQELFPFILLFFLLVVLNFLPYSLILSMQAAKILANLIVMGSGILARAFVQAYRQALASKFQAYIVIV